MGVPEVPGVSGKFDPWNWLLFTQLYEAYTADTDAHRAEELADLISVTLEAIEVLGYDPVSVFERRVGEKAPSIAATRKVFKKYADAYHKVQREMGRWPYNQ
jgi:hypothetical protein